jgi:hypothetical protein
MHTIIITLFPQIGAKKVMVEDQPHSLVPFQHYFLVV